MMRARQGFTLVEVMVALTITALIGAALTSVLVNQSRFYDQQEKLSSARQVSRSAMNILMAELRMVETSGGIVAASPTTITVDVPVAMGVYCGMGSGNRLALMMPADSTVLNRVSVSRIAIRTAVVGPAGYMYEDWPGGNTNSSGCAGYAIPNTEWRVWRWTQTFATEPPEGAPIMALHRVTYSFDTSVSVPGKLALWRRAGTEPREELVAPFDDGAGFAFYVAGSQTPQSAAPTDLTTLRGLEIVLDARSERPGSGGGDADLVSVATAVFFRNSL
jgi:prepilin-type N-terminal cleavage/methylation domain-containing protein